MAALDVVEAKEDMDPVNLVQWSLQLHNGLSMLNPGATCSSTVTLAPPPGETGPMVGLGVTLCTTSTTSSGPPAPPGLVWPDEVVRDSVNHQMVAAAEITE